MPYKSPTSPSSVTDILPTLRAIAMAAERRANEMNLWVDALEGIDPAKIDEHIADRWAGPQWINDAMTHIEAVSHVHSGSSDASQIRLATTGLLNLLVKLQRSAE